MERVDGEGAGPQTRPLQAAVGGCVLGFFVPVAAITGQLVGQVVVLVGYLPELVRLEPRVALFARSDPRVPEITSLLIRAAVVLPLVLLAVIGLAWLYRRDRLRTGHV